MKGCNLTYAYLDQEVGDPTWASRCFFHYYLQHTLALAMLSGADKCCTPTSSGRLPFSTSTTVYKLVQIMSGLYTCCMIEHGSSAQEPVTLCFPTTCRLCGETYMNEHVNVHMICLNLPLLTNPLKYGRRQVQIVTNHVRYSRNETISEICLLYTSPSPRD